MAMTEKYSNLADLALKEQEREARLKKLDQKKRQVIDVQRINAHQRHHNASVRRFYRDYRQGLKNRLSADRTKQQHIFTELCQQALKIQNNKIKETRDIQRQNKEMAIQQQSLELQRLENEWKTNIKHLEENVEISKKDLKMRTDAQRKILRQSQRGYKDRLEKELQDMCNVIVDRDRFVDEFREQDLKQIKNDILKVKFSA